MSKWSEVKKGVDGRDRTCRQISKQVNGEGDRAGGEQIGRYRLDD